MQSSWRINVRIRFFFLFGVGVGRRYSEIDVALENDNITFFIVNSWLLKTFLVLIFWLKTVVSFFPEGTSVSGFFFFNFCLQFYQGQLTTVLLSAIHVVMLYILSWLLIFRYLECQQMGVKGAEIFILKWKLFLFWILLLDVFDSWSLWIFIINAAHHWYIGGFIDQGLLNSYFRKFHLDFSQLLLLLQLFKLFLKFTVFLPQRRYFILFLFKQLGA